MFTLLLSLARGLIDTTWEGITSFQVGITLNMHGIVFHWCETMDLKDVKILTTVIKKTFKVYSTPFKNMIKSSMYITLFLCVFFVLKCMVVFETRVRQGYEKMHYWDYKWKVKRSFLFLLAFISRSCTKATT